MFKCFIQSKQKGWERLIQGMKQLNEAYGKHISRQAPVGHYSGQLINLTRNNDLLIHSSGLGHTIYYL